MNEDDVHELEERLKAMQPDQPGPHIKQRIAQTLSDDSTGAHRPLVFRRPFVVGLAAAAVLGLCAVLAVLMLIPPVEPDIVILQPPVQVPGDVVVADEPMTPTLFALTQAWTESPEAMDELLARSLPTRNDRVAMTDAQTPTPADTERWSNMKELP